MHLPVFINQLPTFRKIIVLVFTALAFHLSNSAIADEMTETYDGIVVEGAYVQTNQAKAKLQLKLKVSNYTSNDLTLIGVNSNSFEHAELLFHIPGDGVEEVDTLTILQEETLDLDTSHIRIELHHSKRAIRPGDKIEFELVFVDQTVQATADIHFSKSL